jgi:hypothetical protein
MNSFASKETGDKSRSASLLMNEAVLEAHAQAWIQIGLALKEIRDDRLFEADGFDTFESYCRANRERWSLTPRQVADKIRHVDLWLTLPRTVAEVSSEVTP